MRTSRLSARLRTVFDMVKGMVCADVGTDHALLPIALAASNSARRVLACDLRPGPLHRAAQNVARWDLCEQITLVRCDGIPSDAAGVQTLILAGMGGELIADILGRAPALREDVQLLLQPMSRAAALRTYLIKNGYQITDERFCRDDGRIYVVMETYQGTSPDYTPAQLETGLYWDCPDGRAYAARRLALLEKQADGLRKSENPARQARAKALDALTEELRRML